MGCEEWKRLAKLRLLSGEMRDIEWSVVLDALLITSEGEGLCEFDEAVDRMATNPRWREDEAQS